MQFFSIMVSSKTKKEGIAISIQHGSHGLETQLPLSKALTVNRWWMDPWTPAI